MQLSWSFLSASRTHVSTSTTETDLVVCVPFPGKRTQSEGEATEDENWSDMEEDESGDFGSLQKNSSEGAPLK